MRQNIYLTIFLVIFSITFINGQQPMKTYDYNASWNKIEELYELLKIETHHKWLNLLFIF